MMSRTQNQARRREARAERPRWTLWTLALIVSGGCGSELWDAGHSDSGPEPDSRPALQCPNGVDEDRDGYGDGCALGPDCDDHDLYINPGAAEACDGKDNNCDGKIDEDVKNACGTCDPNCGSLGKAPTAFPVDPAKDPSLKDADGVSLDPNGDLVLGRGAKHLHYLWIANTYDTGGSAKGCSYARTVTNGVAKNLDPKLYPICRGTLSKVDTVSMKEVARYFTTVCSATGGSTGCLDVNGKPFLREFAHAPSRTAVDYNFDVWVANRAFGGQPSATKVANDPGDCMDRNKNGKIDTSQDLDGDGKITVDCNNDGLPDRRSTACTVASLKGKGPEFLGDDDECVLFTVTYGSAPDPKNPKDLGDVGRSVCLDAGKSTVGASYAWVGTYYRETYGRGVNQYFRINGATGKIEIPPVNLPKGHASYGCTSDGRNQIWSTCGNGTLAFFNTLGTNPVGPLLSSPKVTKAKSPTGWHYGIAVNAEGHIWLGGSYSNRVLRYRPDRGSFSTLHQGTWTILHMPPEAVCTRGVAPDERGRVWVAGNPGFLLRVDQSIADAPPGKDYIEHDLTGSPSIWPIAGVGVSGAGVDIDGNVWGIAGNGLASRLDADGKGDVRIPVTGKTKTVKVGFTPYTYSDFTGYGLQNFVRPQGRYVYRMQPCANGQLGRWRQVSWKATTPAGTSIVLRVRSGNSDASMGYWLGPYLTSPATLDKGSVPLSPNPARFLEVEFTLKTDQLLVTPILHDFDVAFDCTATPT